jgi:hypothetical protein
VRVRAVIERPAKPPWIAELPFPAPMTWWPGNLLGWRWIDRRERTWTALVRYRREGLMYEHWVSGELLDVLPDAGAEAMLNHELGPPAHG